MGRDLRAIAIALTLKLDYKGTWPIALDRKGQGKERRVWSIALELSEFIYIYICYVYIYILHNIYIYT